METERRGEQFTLIEPPDLPEKPLKPNRSAILVLGTVFSFAGGLGTAAMSESLDATVRGVTALLAMPLLAAIPHMETAAERRRRRLKMAAAITAGLTILIGAAAALHLFHMPLDVLWYAALRRFGIQ